MRLRLRLPLPSWPSALSLFHAIRPDPWNLLPPVGFSRPEARHSSLSLRDLHHLDCQESGGCQAGYQHEGEMDRPLLPPSFPLAPVAHPAWQRDASILWVSADSRESLYGDLDRFPPTAWHLFLGRHPHISLAQRCTQSSALAAVCDSRIARPWLPLPPPIPLSPQMRYLPGLETVASIR